MLQIGLPTYNAPPIISKLDLSFSDMLIIVTALNVLDVGA